MDPGVRRDDGEGAERLRAWIPAFAGMTVRGLVLDPGVRRDDGVGAGAVRAWVPAFAGMTAPARRQRDAPHVVIG